MSGPSNSGAFEIDFADFQRKYLEYVAKIAPEAAEKGLFDAITALKNDCDTIQPKTPHLEGNLRGDHSIIITGIAGSRVMAKSGGKGKDHAIGGSAGADRAEPGELSAKLVFRMPYAAKWHEAVNKKVNWSESGVGPKYIEKKLMMFMKKYMGLVAARIKEAADRR